MKDRTDRSRSLAARIVSRLTLLPTVMACGLSLLACGGSALPAPIQEELAHARPDTVTVVAFTDFQCPFCRRTHAKLEEALASRPNIGHVRIVLRHVPLRSHPDARPAALAAVCSERLLSEEDARSYVSALYRSTDLSLPTMERLIVAQGAAVEEFRACLGSEETSARLERDRAIYREAEGSGVPLLYVGRTRLDGEPSLPALENALEAAAADASARVRAK